MIDINALDTSTQRHLAGAGKLLSYVPNNDKFLKMHRSDAKTRLILGGKRSGKTTMSVVECCWAALGIHPFLDYPPPPLKIRYCSVDFTSGVKGIALPMFYEWLPKQAIKRYWSEDRILELTNGTTIQFNSYDQDLEKYEGVARHLVCFDSETEVLSKSGFIKYDQLKIGDEILTYNVESSSNEWKPVTYIYKDENYEGTITSIRQKDFDALVTPDHNWIVSNKDKTRKWKFKFVKTNQLSKRHRIIRAARYKNLIQEKKYSDDVVRLIGWVITDGSYPRNKNEIYVCQSLTKNPQKCNVIRDIFLSVFGVGSVKEYIEPYYKPPLDGRMLMVYGKGEFARLVRKILPDKVLTMGFLLELTQPQLQLLYDAMMDGDGSRCPHYPTFSQRAIKNLPTVDIFHILCVLLGKKAHYNIYGDEHRISISEHKRYAPYTNVGNLKFKEVLHKGIVWCPHTENNTVVVRRNGTIYISGNCMDEEPPKDKYQSNYMRTIADGINGKLIISCTPLHGLNWIYDDLYDNPSAKPPYVDWVHVSIYDNPHLDKDAIDAIKHDPAMKDSLESALYGTFVPKSGLIYKGFDDANIIKPISPIPADWMIVLGIDPHDRNPHGVTFCGLTKDNAWIVFDEILEQCIISDLVALIKKKLGKRFPPNLAIIDTSANAPQSISGMSVSDELRKLGLWTVAAFKDWQPGILKVSSFLDHSDNKPPKLQITENCINTLREFRHYVWADWARSKDRYNPKEMALKKDDHLMDTIRYVVMANLVYRPPDFKLERKIPEHISSTTGYY